MNSFNLLLQDSTRSLELDKVTCCVGEDSSGSFGILPGHARMMTALTFGLARFRQDEQSWRYLAVPGGILYFCNNTLTLNTRRYLIDDDYMRISQALQDELLAEEEQLQTLKKSLQRMEEQVLKGVWELGRRVR